MRSSGIGISFKATTVSVLERTLSATLVPAKISTVEAPLRALVGDRLSQCNRRRVKKDVNVLTSASGNLPS